MRWDERGGELVAGVGGDALPRVSERKSGVLDGGNVMRCACRGWQLLGDRLHPMWCDCWPQPDADGDYGATATCTADGESESCMCWGERRGELAACAGGDLLHCLMRRVSGVEWVGDFVVAVFCGSWDLHRDREGLQHVRVRRTEPWSDADGNRPTFYHITDA